MQTPNSALPQATPDMTGAPPNATQILDPLDELVRRCGTLARRQGRGHEYSGQLAFLELLASTLRDGSIATPAGQCLLATRVVTTVQGWVEQMQDRE